MIWFHKSYYKLYIGKARLIMALQRISCDVWTVTLNAIYKNYRSLRCLKHIHHTLITVHCYILNSPTLFRLRRHNCPGQERNNYCSHENITNIQFRAFSFRFSNGSLPDFVAEQILSGECEVRGSSLCL